MKAEESYYYRVIDEYINGEAKDFSKIYQIGCKAKILTSLKKYLSHKPSEIAKVKYIAENIDTLLKAEYSHEGFIDNIRYLAFVDRKSSKHYYEHTLNLLTGDIEKTIFEFRRLHLDRYEYNCMMDEIKKRFPNQPNEYAYLDEAYEKYLKEFGIKENKPVQKTYVSKRFKSSKFISKKNSDIVEMVYESGLCVEEFCSNTGFSLYAVNHLMESKVKKIQPMLEEIKVRDNKDFKKYIDGVLADMISMEEFDILDYYDRTKLSDIDFKKYIPNNLDADTLKKIYAVLNQTRVKIYGGRKSVISSKTTINGIEVTPEEKTQIFNYMDEKGYPDCTYRVVLDKYLAGELSFDQKIKEKF